MRSQELENSISESVQVGTSFEDCRLRKFVKGRWRRLLRLCSRCCRCFQGLNGEMNWYCRRYFYNLNCCGGAQCNPIRRRRD